MSEQPPSQPQPPSRRPYSLIILALAAVLAAVTAWRVSTVAVRGSGGLVGGPFVLQGGDGKTVTDKDLLGHPFLVYFGYTHCPDVCPTELAAISDVFKQLPDKPVKALFITIDPERDTPKLMADYVSSFNSRIVGLSGPPEAVAAAEKAYRVYSQKADVQPDGSYSMNHTSIVYLMDARGEFVEAFNLDRPAKASAAELAGYL